MTKPMEIAKTESRKSRLKDQSGIITLDFIFALTVTISVTMVFGAVAVTLSTVELAQYVAYTTSRAYAGAHETPQAQSDLANARYTEVMALSGFKTFLSQDWMKLGAPQLGDFSSDYDSNDPHDVGAFVGAKIPLNAKLLNLNVPFLGATASDSGVGQATLNSYLMREVTTQECRENFTRARFQQLKAISANGANYSSVGGSQEALITDNGC